MTNSFVDGVKTADLYECSASLCRQAARFAGHEPRWVASVRICEAFPINEQRSLIVTDDVACCFNHLERALFGPEDAHES